MCALRGADLAVVRLQLVELERAYLPGQCVGRRALKHREVSRLGPGSDDADARAGEVEATGRPPAGVQRGAIERRHPGIVSVHTQSCWISSEKLYEYSMLSMSHPAPGYRLTNHVPPTASAISSTMVHKPCRRSSYSM